MYHTRSERLFLWHKETGLFLTHFHLVRSFFFMLEGVAAEVEASSSATLFFPCVAAISMTVDLRGYFTRPTAGSCTGSGHKIVHSTHYTLIGLCLWILLISSARWLAPNTHPWKQRMIDELCLSDRKRKTLKYLCHFVFVSYDSVNVY